MSEKVIWIYWHQGWEEAPELVKRCHHSWIRINPDYKIYALDRNSLFQYINFPKEMDIHRKDLTIQKRINSCFVSITNAHRSDAKLSHRSIWRYFFGEYIKNTYGLEK